MDPATVATITVAALSPYLVEVAKGTAGKAGESAHEAAAKLLKFLKNKLAGADQRALSRVEQQPEDADNQAVLRVVLKEWVERYLSSRDELEALLKALPQTAAYQSANVVGHDSVIVQAVGTNIKTEVGRK